MVSLRPHDRLEFGFEASPIAVSGLLDLIGLIYNGCFAHAALIDPCGPSTAPGYRLFP